MTTLNSPAATSEAVYDRNGVRRSKDGRPYVKCPCPVPDCVDGKVPSEKTGRPIKCQRCKGNGGQHETLYTRCTSFVGALEARDNLEKWKQRITVLGLAVHPGLWTDLASADPDDRDAIDAIVEIAFEAGDGYAAAQKGTDLHYLSEHVDDGRDLPATTPEGAMVTLQDRADMGAYVRVRDHYGLRFTDAECFVVNDEYRIGGTFDRRVEPFAVEGRPVCSCGRPLVFDLKTGRIDYGAGKIAQQLAVYAHSERYDPDTGQRSPLNVCQHVGVIMHLPQGTGDASLHTVDIVSGWNAVRISDEVRRHRRESQAWITPVTSSLLLDLALPSESP